MEPKKISKTPYIVVLSLMIGIIIGFVIYIIIAKVRKTGPFEEKLPRIGPNLIFYNSQDDPNNIVLLSPEQKQQLNENLQAEADKLTAININVSFTINVANGTTTSVPIDCLIFTEYADSFVVDCESGLVSK